LGRGLPILATLAGSLALTACGSGGTGSATPATVTSAPAARSPTPVATTAPSAISINAPSAGASVRVPFDISGGANVFEAVLQVQILGQDGRMLCQRTVQATSGTGTPGTWTTTMAFAPPQVTGRATIRAFSISPRDGSEQNVVTRDIQLQADAPAIVIAQPRCNADVPQGSTLAVSGTASVFEASLLVELRDGRGAPLVMQIVTADAAGPATGRWSTTLDLAGIVAGAYELVAYDLSARDGTPENVFAIPIRITV
jgi:hypothetical protein